MQIPVMGRQCTFLCPVLGIAGSKGIEHSYGVWADFYYVWGCGSMGACVFEL